MNNEEPQQMVTILDNVDHRAPDERIACTIVRQAIRDGASEIYIEPTDERINVAFRIGNNLRETILLPTYMHIPLAVRFKAMADLDVTCDRSSQDGDMWVHTEGKGYRLHLSTKPTEFGESLLIRLPV